MLLLYFSATMAAIENTLCIIIRLSAVQRDVTLGMWNCHYNLVVHF